MYNPARVHGNLRPDLGNQSLSILHALEVLRDMGFRQNTYHLVPRGPILKIWSIYRFCAQTVTNPSMGHGNLRPHLGILYS